MNRQWSWIVLLVAMVLFGCNRSRTEPTFAVSGTVTLDGQPLAEGEIYFVTPASGQVDILPIRGGKFQGQAKAGQRRVEIYAYRMEQPEAPPDMPGLQLEPARVNYLPEKYNRQSELTAEISADKPNQLTFEVTSQ